MIAKRNNYYTSRKILVSYFVFLVIIPYLLLSVIQIVTYLRSIRMQTIDPSRAVVELINLSVEKQTYKIQNFITAITTSHEFKDFMEESYTNKYGSELSEKYYKLDDLISNNIQFDLKTNSVVILNRENKVFSYGNKKYFDYEKVKDSLWYQETMEADGQLCWFTDQKDEDGTFNFNLFAAQKLYDMETFEEIGTIYIEVQNDFFDMRISKEESQYLMYIVDKDEEPLLSLVQNDNAQNRELVKAIAHNVIKDNYQENKIYTINGKNYFPVMSAPNSHGWHVVKVIPVDEMLGSVAKSSILSGAILICCFILFLCMFLIVYKRISQPMQYLIGLLNEIKADPEINIDLGKYPCYEAMRLSTEIISLSREKETINNELKEVSGSKNKMELDKLQAEINPHFIFNTLTAIKYMAIQNHQKEISDMITALVKILRSTVNRDGRFITVAEEVDNLRQYIHIQSVLNKDRIEFTIETDPEVEKCYMPNFILQPLVENAVIHGLNPKGCEGKIGIYIGNREGKMYIEVIDDGVGVDMEKVNISNPVHTKGTGVSNIALPGVMKKIELLYDQKGVFRIDPVLSGGTKVTIILPIKFEN